MELEKGVLYFKLGENFGSILHQIAWEHIVLHFEHEKAFHCFCDSGAPHEYWLKLLRGEYLLTVGEDEETLIIKKREDLSEEELAKYPPLLTTDFIDEYMVDEFEAMCKAYRDIRSHFSSICNYNITLSKEDLDILYDCDISSKIPGEWTFSTSFVDYWKVSPYH